ncbi:MAG: sulfotransferase domain-containing protein [Caldilineaceae bacterium]
MKKTIQDHHYLIIAGTTKAASTSLYSFLADHPHVIASDPKETRFFLDSDYPLYARFHLSDGIDKYDTFFRDTSINQEALRMESSPQYLYGQNSAENIASSLPNVKLIFILREPIARLLSYYGFAIQQGELDSSLSIDDYIDIQLNRPALTGHSVDAMNALQQGCYSQYLSRYLDLFPSGQILIINFEYLTQSPLKMMEIICSFARLNPDFYQDYKFSVYNPTHSPRFPKMNRFYRQFARSVSNQLYQLPLFWNPLRQCFRQSQSFMQYFGKQPAKKPKLSEPLREAVTRFYEPESTKLANIFQHSSHHWSGSNAFSYWIN